jgi:hypothetical protein
LFCLAPSKRSKMAARIRSLAEDVTQWFSYSTLDFGLFFLAYSTVSLDSKIYQTSGEAATRQFPLKKDGLIGGKGVPLREKPPSVSRRLGVGEGPIEKALWRLNEETLSNRRRTRCRTEGPRQGRHKPVDYALKHGPVCHQESSTC